MNTWLTSSAIFAASVLMTWPCMVILRRLGVVDRPNARSSHVRPTIRGGGVSFVVILLSFASMQGGVGAALAVACAAVAAVSFADDLRSLGAFWRFLVHIVAAIGFVVYIVCIHGLPADFICWAICGCSIAWIVGYTNAYNFMDGINGIAAVQAIIAGLGISLVAWLAGLPLSHPAVLLSLGISAAASGFLPFNFPRAKVFMGDVGSASLGFMLSSLCVWVAVDAGWPYILPLGALHLNYVLDVGVTMFRRFLRGERLHEAHRSHYYQLAVRSGLSHTRVSTVIGLLQVAMVTIVGLSVHFEVFWLPYVAGLILWPALFWSYDRRFTRGSRLEAAAGRSGA